VRLLLRWAVAAAAVGASAWLLPGIRIEGGVGAFFLVALVLGLVNALVRPLLRRLSCALIFLTLGLFLFVINALMLVLTAYLARMAGVGFSIDSFGDALIGAFIISLVSFLLSVLLPDPASRGRRRR
jgi:putative membrane protein